MDRQMEDQWVSLPAKDPFDVLRLSQSAIRRSSVIRCRVSSGDDAKIPIESDVSLNPTSERSIEPSR